MHGLIWPRKLAVAFCLCCWNRLYLRATVSAGECRKDSFKTLKVTVMKFKSFEIEPVCSCIIGNLAIPCVCSSVCMTFILKYIKSLINAFLNRCTFPLAIKLCPNIVCAVKNHPFPSARLENITNEEKRFSSSSLPILYIPSGFSLQDFSAHTYFLLQKATPISLVISHLLSMLAKSMQQLPSSTNTC